MLITNTVVFGFEAALRSMRHPRKSYDKADSFFYEAGQQAYKNLKEAVQGSYPLWNPIFKVPECPFIGPADLKLLTTLYKTARKQGRASHSKILRMIHISADFILPRYTWTDMDTYKVATVRMSESSVFNLKTCMLDPTDFEDQEVDADHLARLHDLQRQIMHATNPGEVIRYIRKLKKRLPEGYLQLATLDFNYQTASDIFHDRKNHILEEFNLDDKKDSICKWISSLPYAAEFIIGAE